MDHQTAEPILRGAVDFFEEAQAHEQRWRTEWEDDLRFRALEQWPDAAIKARNVPGEPPRPTLTFDQTDQYVRQVTNTARMSPPALKAQPVDDKADLRVAEDLQGLFRHIERVSRADRARMTALEWAVVTGRGFMRVYSHLVDEERNFYEPRIARVPNGLLVYFDPYSVEMDGSDATDAMVAIDYSPGGFKRKWSKAEVTGSWDTAPTGWRTSDTIRVVEWHSVRKREETVVVTIDGAMTHEEAQRRQVQSFREEKRERKVCTIRTCTAVEVLDETEFHAPYVGLVPVYGNERYTPDGRVLFGLIRAAKDPQRLTNYLGSNLAEAANGQTKSPWVAPHAAIAGHEAAWAKANQSNVPVLPYNHVNEAGEVIPPPSRQSVDLQLSGYVQLMQWSHLSLQQSLGLFQASVGAPSNETSGVAIENRKANSDVGSYHYIDNLGDSVQHTGRIIMAMLPKVYDRARVARILGEDDETSQVLIDPNAREAFAERAEGGRKIHVLNPMIGEYDIHVTVGPSFATKREQTVATVGAMLERNPAMMQLLGDIFFRNQDLPGAQEMAKRLKAMLPDQIKAIEEEGEVPPEVRELVQRLTQAMNLREQAVVSAQQEAQKTIEAAKQERSRAEVAAAHVKTAEAQLEVERERLANERADLEHARQLLVLAQRDAAKDAARMTEDINRAAADGARQVQDAFPQEPTNA